MFFTWLHIRMSRTKDSTKLYIANKKRERKKCYIQSSSKIIAKFSIIDLWIIEFIKLICFKVLSFKRKILLSKFEN